MLGALPITLTPGQLKLIATQSGLRSGEKLLDIGAGRGEWLSSLRAMKIQAIGLEDLQGQPDTPIEGLSFGSPAASVPGEVQSCACVVFRGTSLFQAQAFHPELMIALANMGAMLKPNAKLIIPVTSVEGSDVTRWSEMLKSFPGDVRVRTLNSGFFASLFGGRHTVSIIELNIRKQQISKLEWHKLARESVLSHSRSKTEAA